MLPNELFGNYQEYPSFIGCRMHRNKSAGPAFLFLTFYNYFPTILVSAPRSTIWQIFLNSRMIALTGKHCAFYVFQNLVHVKCGIKCCRSCISKITYSNAVRFAQFRSKLAIEEVFDTWNAWNNKVLII